MIVYIGILSGFTHFLYWVFLSKAYEKGDLSHVYPIMRSAPALVFIFSVIVLKEKVSLIGVLRIIIVATGIYLINLKKINLKNFLDPIRSILIFIGAFLISIAK